MENRQLFLRVLQDLERRLHSNDEYDVLNIARLLRQLLLGGGALVHEIVGNQPIRLQPGSPGVPIAPKLQFEVNAYTVPKGRPDFFWSILDGFDPIDPAWQYLRANRPGFHVHTVGQFHEDGTPSPPLDEGLEKLRHEGLRKRVCLDIDRFLKHPVIIYRTESFTVKSVILFLSNTSGAVHSGRPTDSRLQALDEIMHFIRLQSLPLGVYMLLPIGRVVRRSLEPLKHYVESGPLFSRANQWSIAIADQQIASDS